MSFNWKASGLFAAGVAFGTAGIKILSSKDAKRAYTQCTAAALRAKDCVMKTVNTVQENATIDDAIEEEAANKADARLDGADSTQDVYFTVKDSNLVRNQIDEKTVVYLDFYIEDPQKNPNDETIGTGNDKIYLKKVDWDIYTLNNDGTENEQINNSKENSQLNKDPRDFFENNKTYKVKVPLSVLPEGANSIKIYAVGYSKIYQSQVSGGDKETTTAKAYKTFQIQRVGLADLD